MQIVLDLVVHNGIMVGGTGTPGYCAGVAFEGGRLPPLVRSQIV